MLKGEYDFLVASLSERLDLAKCRGFLHCSLDLRLMNASDPSFLHYVGLGKDYLGNFVTRRLHKTGLGLQSKYMHRSFAASVVDDCNLAHVTQVLRIEELLESNFQDLPVSVSALVLLAILGNLRYACCAGLRRVCICIGIDRGGEYLLPKRMAISGTPTHRLHASMGRLLGLHGVLFGSPFTRFT